VTIIRNHHGTIETSETVRRLARIVRIISRQRSIYGSLTGVPIDGEDTLALSVLENIRPMIETFPLEQAAEAYARMIQGKARFRVALVSRDGVACDVASEPEVAYRKRKLPWEAAAACR